MVFRRILKSLQLINEMLDRIQPKLEVTMATLQNFKDLVSGINTETDRLAAKIEDLTTKLGQDGLTAEEEDQALAELSAVAERLKTIGADPSNPIPTEPPTV